MAHHLLARPAVHSWDVPVKRYGYGRRYKQISYSEFKEAIRSDRVTEVFIKGDIIQGEHADGQQGRDRPVSEQSQSEPASRFATVRPPLDDPQLLELLQSRGVSIQAETTQNARVGTLLIALLPWLLIVGLFLYAGKRMQNRMGGAQDGLFGFSRSKTKLFSKENVNVHSIDVAGLDNAKKELQEMVDFLKDSQNFLSLAPLCPKAFCWSVPRVWAKR